MDKKKLTEDLDPHQERMLREMISKEMLRKIQSRVDSEDSNVLKSFKSLMDEQTEKKDKMSKKISNILKEKQSENNSDEE